MFVFSFDLIFKENDDQRKKLDFFEFKKKGMENWIKKEEGSRVKKKIKRGRREKKGKRNCKRKRWIDLTEKKIDKVIFLNKKYSHSIKIISPTRIV